jgi:hypothetical protein
MKHLRTAIVAAAVPALILIMFAVSAAVAFPPQGKTTVCHATGKGFHQITISNSALPAHLRHGDVPLDEYGECP